MNYFIIKRLNITLELDKPLNNIEGFKYTPKLIKNNYLGIKNIIIVNEELIDKLIIASFDKKYKKIIEFYLKTLSNEEEGDTETSLMLALDEIARLRNIIIKKYQKTLSKKTTEKLLKKLKILENEIRIKVIDYKIIEEQLKEPVSSKSR